MLKTVWKFVKTYIMALSTTLQHSFLSKHDILVNVFIKIYVETTSPAPYRDQIPPYRVHDIRPIYMFWRSFPKHAMI